MRASFVCLLLCLGANAASAATYVFPRNGLSSADEAYVLYTEACGLPDRDATRAPEIRREGQIIRVDLYRVRPQQPDICFSAGPPPTLHPIALGRLPEGFFSVEMREHVRDHDATVYTLLDSNYEGLEVAETPNPAISGGWYDPTRSGTGVFINLVPSPGQFEPLALLVLSTLDAAGTPVWYSGAGTFSNATLDIALTRGGDAATTARAIFRYEGCGQATFRVDGPPLRFPVGETPVTQLTRTLDVAGCSPSTYSLRGE
jgi:hypothetical protein